MKENENNIAIVGSDDILGYLSCNSNEDLLTDLFTHSNLLFSKKKRKTWKKCLIS